MYSLTLENVCRLLNISNPLPSSLTPIRGYQVDSRAIGEGELFIALEGERTDGHHFLDQVRLKGAVGAIVSSHYEGEMEGFPLLRVEDPLQALQDIARKILSKSKPRIIAITGSVGKTSTKEFIKSFLSTKYNVGASPGNQNSQVGLPLTILNHTDGSEDLLILEMGMTEAGQLTRLVDIAPPEVAVITSIGLVHACNFHSIDEIASAKGEILSHPQTKLGIVHRDIPSFNRIAQIGSCNKLSFSLTSPLADYAVERNFTANSIIINAHQEGRTVPLEGLQLPGAHNWHNVLAAIAVARYFNVDWSAIIKTIPSLSLPDKRLQFVLHKNIVFVNDSYNASEISVKAALEALPSPKGEGRKIAVLGSMGELGKFSHDCHQRVGEYALHFVEKIYCLGKECRPILDLWEKEGKPINLFQTRQELVECLKNELREEDVVLIKGSRYHELWKVLEEFI